MQSRSVDRSIIQLPTYLSTYKGKLKSTQYSQYKKLAPNAIKRKGTYNTLNGTTIKSQAVDQSTIQFQIFFAKGHTT